MRMRYVRLLAFALGTMVGLAGLSEAATVARMTPSGDSIELEYSGENGMSAKDTIPIHQAGPIRYFSAGVGLEEREATYPPFPLKLIFVAGPKAYASLVSVTIKDAKGAVRLEIPAEQVAGPWLFVDLPVGTYEISATRGGQTQSKQHVEIVAGRTKSLYLRWKE